MPKTLEQKLAALSAHTRTEDSKDAAGVPRSIADRLEIALARKTAAEPPKTPPTPAEQVRETGALEKLLEAERLANSAAQTRATAELTTARSTIASLETQLGAARAEIAQGRAGFELTISTLTAERDTARSERDGVKGRLRLLEGLAGVRGIRAEDAPPAVEAPGPSVTVASYEARFAAAKTDGERNAIAAELEQAHKDGRLK